MSDVGGKNAPVVNVGSITIVTSGPQAVQVTVTSGTLAGKSARLITVPPSNAYFNEPGVVKAAPLKSR